ncbi:MAG TPA: Rieske (2Fe-2S) protein [bacterium]|nr:Rieske (2Fe-2S) protein [bacterium]
MDGVRRQPRATGNASPGRPAANGHGRLVGTAFILSILASLALTAVYAVGGQPQLEGALLAVSLGTLGAGIILWARDLLIPEEISEEREPEPSPPGMRAAAETALQMGGRQLTRRTALSRLLIGALGALGLAALFPIRSLGPGPGRSLFHTQWSAGARVVDNEGHPVSVRDLEVGSVVTVFPEGFVGSPVSQVLLIRVEPGSLQLRPGRLAWAPDGVVAFSKICTHAGCPVGLYDASTHQLLCPCHQSTFDVLSGATPVFGPASRPLPQLPLEARADGVLRARADFQEPVGPGFWDRP